MYRRVTRTTLYVIFTWTFAAIPEYFALLSTELVDIFTLRFQTSPTQTAGLTYKLV